MDERVMDYLIRRAEHGEDSRRGRRDYEDGRRGRRRDRYGRFARDYDYGRKDRNRDMREGRDYDDYDNDYGYEEDYDDEPLYLSKHDLHKWKKMLKNFDGSTGEHYTMDQIVTAAHKQNITFEDYDEQEFCMTVNMAYADFGGVFKKYVPPERELAACIDWAKAFLEDKDGPEPSEKLAVYFHRIVCSKV